MNADTKDIDVSVKKTLAKLAHDANATRVPWQSYPLLSLRVAILELARTTYNASPAILGKLYLEAPPAHVDAHFVFSAYPLAKSAGKKPADVATELAEKIKTLPLVRDAVALNGYVNIHVDEKAFYTAVLGNVLQLGQAFGDMDVFKGKTLLIDYSSPNIAKPIGIGHMRSTVIGQALGNIYEAAGYSVVRDNHLGDWGTQFGSLICAYKKWGDEAKLKEHPINELKELYVKFTAEAEKDPALKDEARATFAALEKGDPELIKLWQRFYILSVEEFERTYKRLNVSFDTSIGESYFLKDTEPIVSDIISKKIATTDAAGAVVVESLTGVPSFLLKKSDGSSLYITRDLATLKFRTETFKPDSIFYVVGSEQELNFKQFFALAEASGMASPGKLVHVGFGLVMKDGKKMSTRKGTLVELDQVLDEAVSRSRAVLAEKNADMSASDMDEISSVVGVGSVIYNDLRQSRMKNIQFDWDRMLDFEAGSAVYLQYTVVRIRSILEKAGTRTSVAYTFSEKPEFELVRKVSMFPEIILQAVEHIETHVIAGYLEDLAGAFNSLYAAVPVLTAPTPELVASRLALIESVATTISRGLALLNIGIPKKL